MQESRAGFLRVIHASGLHQPRITESRCPACGRLVGASSDPALIQLAEQLHTCTESRNGSLDEVLITHELAERSSRSHDRLEEINALHRLASLFSSDGDILLEALLDHAMALCGAQSAGISLEQSTEGKAEEFCWIVTAGAFRQFVGGTTPRDFSPCGITLDENAAQLFRRPETVYTYLRSSPKPIYEGLLVPWHGADGVNGTLWVVSHVAGHRFDLEDVRILEGLSSFVVGALRHRTVEQAARGRVAVEAKAQLAQELAHKINNPLQAAVNALFLLKEPSSKAPSRLLKTAQHELERVSELVNQILRLGR